MRGVQISLLLLTLATLACRAQSGSALKGDQDPAPELLNPAPLARFEAWMQDLAPALGENQSGSDAAKDLLNEDAARIAAFNLQALGRLYTPFDEAFAAMRSGFKDIEDGIGEYDKWKKILKVAQDSGNLQAIENAKAKIKQAKEDFATKLTETGWADAEPTRLAQIKDFLTTFAWKSYDDDKAVMLDALSKRLAKIDGATWDLSRLEEGNGLHELRREIRWFLIEARVLNGMMTFRDDDADCPVAAYAGLVDSPVANSKYGKLPRAATEVSPCLISRCLFLGGVQVVERLGELKDQAEQINNTTNPPDPDLVPADIKAAADQLYEEMKANKLLSELTSQINQCKGD